MSCRNVYGNGIVTVFLQSCTFHLWRAWTSLFSPCRYFRLWCHDALETIRRASDADPNRIGNAVVWYYETNPICPVLLKPYSPTNPGLCRECEQHWRWWRAPTTHNQSAHRPHTRWAIRALTALTETPIRCGLIGWRVPAFQCCPYSRLGPNPIKDPLFVVVFFERSSP